VIVVPIQQLYITPTLTDLAPDIDQQYELYGLFQDNPVPVNLTTSAAWDLNGETSRAFVNVATGVVHAGAASTGAPIEAVAHLPACGLEATHISKSRTSRRCGSTYEFTPPANLPVGTSLKVRVWGDFGDSSHTSQNLSRAVDIQNRSIETAAGFRDRHQRRQQHHHAGDRPGQRCVDHRRPSTTTRSVRRRRR